MKPIRECKVCHRERGIHARGMCGACYQRWRDKPSGECSRCGRTAPELRKYDRLCRTCIDKDHLAANPPVPRKCAECGQERVIRARGLCGSCYNRYRYDRLAIENPAKLAEIKRKDSDRKNALYKKSALYRRRKKEYLRKYRDDPIERALANQRTREWRKRHRDGGRL